MATPAKNVPMQKRREPVSYKDAADRFKQIGQKRLKAAVKMIGLIGNLSGAGYEFTDEQVEKIRSTLQEATDNAMARFDKERKKTLTSNCSMPKPKLVDFESSGFVLTDALRNWLVSEYPTIDADKTYELFCDHALAKGWVYASWSAAFRNYIRRAKEYGGVVYAYDPAFVPLLKWASDIDFRKPHEGESVGVYRTKLKEFDAELAVKQKGMFDNVIRRFPK